MTDAVGELLSKTIIVLRLTLESAINLGPVPEIDLDLIGMCIYELGIYSTQKPYQSTVSQVTIPMI